MASSSLLPDQYVWIASYPKSGNTWMRFIIANIMSGGVSNSNDIEGMVPDIHRGPLRPALHHCGRAFAKTHFAYGSVKQQQATVGAVYIVRHPLDVLVSHLDYFGLNEQPAKASKFIDEFINYGGYPHWGELGFGTWQKHVRSWTFETRRFPRLFVRYEDLLTDTTAEVTRVFEFLEIDAAPEDIARACEQSSFKSLRKMEQTEQKESSSSGFFAAERRQKGETFRFMSKGVSGRYQERLAPEHLELASNKFGATMKLLGYSNG